MTGPGTGCPQPAVRKSALKEFDLGGPGPEPVDVCPPSRNRNRRTSACRARRSPPAGQPPDGLHSGPPTLRPPNPNDRWKPGRQATPMTSFDEFAIARAAQATSSAYPVFSASTISHRAPITPDPRQTGDHRAAPATRQLTTGAHSGRRPKPAPRRRAARGEREIHFLPPQQGGGAESLTAVGDRGHRRHGAGPTDGRCHAAARTPETSGTHSRSC